jgi:hypothetical protein
MPRVSIQIDPRASNNCVFPLAETHFGRCLPTTTANPFVVSKIVVDPKRSNGVRLKKIQW